ncbi:hypothetical protein [Basilea psittacipulmonis]|uniref:hypothetical protein n=1 Tax=Basilea psittacipulmonis TaxID=1472345 RepID=UPI0006908B02|nr:hypothetical protein [Basilea psittacipulmonis]
MPRWVVVLLTGIVVGAGGFWFLQTNYGPKRFTVEESQAFIDDVKKANDEKRHFETLSMQQESEIAQLKNRLGIVTNETESQNKSLKAIQDRVSQLQDEVTLLREALASGTQISELSLRTAKVTSIPGKLNYTLYFLGNMKTNESVDVTLEFDISGVYENGKAGYAKPESRSVLVSSITRSEGEIDLPNKLQAKSITIRLKDTKTGRSLGRRNFPVN